jgi:Ca-activated chloride channel homolog
MRILHPWGLLGALGLIPVLLLHLLRPARRTVVVSSTWLWRAAAIPVTSRKPWDKLRWSLPLVLQLLGVLALTGALSRPTIERQTTFAEHTVFMVDTSASMQSTDAEPTRMDAAKAEIRALRRKLPSGGVASLVTTDGRVMLSNSDSTRAFDDAVGRLRAGWGAPDIALTSLIAQGLQTAERETGFVLVSDGRITAAEQRLLPPGVRFQPIGSTGADLAVLDLRVSRAAAGLTAVARTINRASSTASSTLVFFVDSKPVQNVPISVIAGSVTVTSVDLPAGSAVEARLTNTLVSDVLPADDAAFAVAQVGRAVRVRIVAPTEPDVFLAAALRVAPGVEVVTAADTPVDLTIYDRIDPPASLLSPALLIAPPKGFSTVQVGGTVDAPALTDVDGADPVLVGLDLSDIVIERAQMITPGDAEVLIAAPESPLLLRGRAGEKPFIYLAFEPASSNLPLDLAFPVLVDRAVRDLTSSGVDPTGFRVGDLIAPVADAQRQLVDPNGLRRSVGAGDPVPFPDRPGIWQLRTGDAVALSVAVNLPTAETDATPVTKLTSLLQGSDRQGARSRSEQSLLPWIAALCALIFAGEFLSARRRFGVSPQQWRFAKIARIAAALLVLGAIVAPRLRIPTQRVSTVFAVDVSDSMGPAGRRQAIEAVEQALVTAPKSSRAGVIVFGGNARVRATVRNRLSLPDVEQQIDGSRTDLASALRLAGALNPTDAARRVVLISDGRRTDGDDPGAADELREAGVRVDVIAVGSQSRSDVAVASFDAPQRAAGGELTTLRAVLQAYQSGPATVTLKANGEVVQSSAVELVAGQNPWSIDLIAPAGGLVRWSLEVTRPGDEVIQNDLAAAATSLEAETRVLVLSGASSTYDSDQSGTNGGDRVVTQLRGAGLTVDQLPAAQFGGFDDLAGVSAVVLVDVHARELGAAQVATLTAAVRELGVGMTVIGGNNSFGSGGYLGSDLEALLPVVSEVNDPKRVTQVGIVYIVDTSGSMGVAVDGKRTALDLAKSAASGSAAQLKADDWVGALGVDDGREWVLDVQQRPKDAGAKSISKLQLGGGTVLEGSLVDAAGRLSKATVGVRHIVVLSDGYTADPKAFLAEAASVRASGVTVSVVGAGSDVETDFPKVAVVGGGRYVQATNFTDLPALFSEETQTVARNLVVEGTVRPRITGAAAPVRTLSSAPSLEGYQATTAKPTAQTSLRVGTYDDPLVSSWQAGLGRVTAWTSDAGQRWATKWTTWDEPFLATVVKDTMLNGGTGNVRASVEGDSLAIRVTGDNWTDGTEVTATVRGPGGEAVEVPLQRANDGAFVGRADALAAGTYAVGAIATDGGAAVFRGGSTSIRSYSAEYRPGELDRSRLEGLSLRTGGRGIITPVQAFDAAQLQSGRRALALTVPLLVGALLLWVLAVALWRLPLRLPSGVADSAAPKATKRARPSPPNVAQRTPSAPPAEHNTFDPPVPEELPPSSLDQLLAKARESRNRD